MADQENQTKGGAVMQNPNTGDFHLGNNQEELTRQRQSFLDAMEPKKRSSLQDERLWPIFKAGETVFVRNEEGAEAKCVVENIGKKMMMLRGIPRT
jgi:hypothetical protein